LATRELRVVLVGDSASLQRAFERSQAQAEKYGVTMSKVGDRVTASAAKQDAALTRVGRRMESFGTKTKRLGSDLTHHLTVPIAAIGLGSAKMAQDFEDAMNKVVRLAGASNKEVDHLKGTVLKLSKETGAAPKELADGLYFIYSAGLRGKEGVDALRTSAKLSVAGLGQLHDVADAITSAMNSYGKENISAAKAGDILAATAREGKRQASEYAAVIGRVIPLAANMGLSFDQVGAALAAMTRQGLNAAQASTQLRGLLASIEKPSTSFEKALSAIGLSAEGLRKEIKEKGLLAAINDMAKSAKEHGQSIAQIIPNAKGLIGALELTGKNAKDNKKIFDDLAHSTGSSEKAFKQFEKTSKAKTEKALNDLRIAGIELGEKVLPKLVPVVVKVAHAVERLVDGFTHLPKGVQGAIGKIVLFGAALGPVLKIAGNFAKVLGLISLTGGKMRLPAAAGAGGAAAGSGLVRGFARNVPLFGAAAAFGLYAGSRANTTNSAGLPGTGGGLGNFARALHHPDLHFDGLVPQLDFHDPEKKVREFGDRASKEYRKLAKAGDAVGLERLRQEALDLARAEPQTARTTTEFAIQLRKFANNAHAAEKAIGKGALQRSMRQLGDIRFPSEPLVFKQLSKDFKKLPPEARAHGAATMIEFSRSLEKNGRLPKGATNRLIKDIARHYPELIPALRNSGHNSMKALERALGDRKVVNTVKDQVAQIRKTWGEGPPAAKVNATSARTIWAQEMDLLKRKIAHSTGEQRDVAVKQYRQMKGLTGQVARQWRDEMARTSGDMRGKWGDDLDKLAKHTSGTFSVLSGVVQGGLNTIKSSVNDTLGPLGAGRPFKITHHANPAEQRNLTHGATGTRVPGPVGPDSVPVVDARGRAKAIVAPGELLVANRHTEARVDRLLAPYGTSLGREVAGESRRHDAPMFSKGGRTGGASHMARLLAAANKVSAQHWPYHWGGGHEQPAHFEPFDCSGAVSYIVQQAGYKVPTTVGPDIGSWGFPHGPGAATIFYNGRPIRSCGSAGRYWGTSGFARPGGGAGWFNKAPSSSYLGAFNVVHLPNLGGDASGIPLPVIVGPDGALLRGGNAALKRSHAAAVHYVNKKISSIDAGSGQALEGGPGGKLGRPAMRALLHKYRLPDLGGYVAWNESDLDPHADNGIARGLFQINYHAHADLARRFNLSNPDDNTRAAAGLYHSAGNSFYRDWAASLDSGAHGGWRQDIGKRFAHGGRLQYLGAFGDGVDSMYVDKPSLMVVGEAGPEEVTVHAAKKGGKKPEKKRRYWDSYLHRYVYETPSQHSARLQREAAKRDRAEQRKKRHEKATKKAERRFRKRISGIVERDLHKGHGLGGRLAHLDDAVTTADRRFSQAETRLEQHHYNTDTERGSEREARGLAGLKRRKEHEIALKRKQRRLVLEQAHRYRRLLHDLRRQLHHAPSKDTRKSLRRRIKNVHDAWVSLRKQARDLGLDIGDLKLEAADLQDQEDDLTGHKHESEVAVSAVEKAIDTINLHEEAGDISAAEAERRRHRVRQRALSSGHLSAHDALALRAEDKQDGAASAADLAGAMKDLATEMKAARLNAQQVLGTETGVLWKALGDLVSGQIASTGYAPRARTAGDGSVLRF
jgi:TP901 family phage tail tape measure protein